MLRPRGTLVTRGATMNSSKEAPALMLDSFPPAKAVLRPRRRLVRNALAERGIKPCIPSKTNRKIPIPHDRALYRQRHTIENIFRCFKDWPSPL